MVMETKLLVLWLTVSVALVVAPAASAAATRYAAPSPDTVIATHGAGVALDVVSGSATVPPPHCAPFTGNASLTNVIAHGELVALQTSDSVGAGCTQNSKLAVQYSNLQQHQSRNGPTTDGGHNQVSGAATAASALFAAFPSNLHERAGAATIDAGLPSGGESTDLDGNPRAP